MPGSTSTGSPPGLQDADERGEEVRHAVAQLLHVGVLVGRALVAVDREALVHALPVQVEPLAERLHHQLLEVAAEEQQTVLVGQHHQVLGALPARRVVPHQRQERRGVRAHVLRRASPRRRPPPRPGERRRRSPAAPRARGPPRSSRSSAHRPNPTWGSARASPALRGRAPSLRRSRRPPAWRSRARRPGTPRPPCSIAVARLGRAAALRGHARRASPEAARRARRAPARSRPGRCCR